MGMFYVPKSGKKPLTFLYHLLSYPIPLSTQSAVTIVPGSRGSSRSAPSWPQLRTVAAARFPLRAHLFRCSPPDWEQEE